MTPPQVSLEVVPEHPIRVLGLVRVSKAKGREDMVSPEVQRHAITDYARTRGYLVTGWLEGLDESGSRSKSAWWARLDQAVGMVEGGSVDAIVVWKFSRTARHRLKWAVALDKVESAGGRLESATEQVDTTTSTGKFTRGMLAELNAFEADRIGEVWKEVQANRVAKGFTHNGKARWGYVYDRDAKLHRPDPGSALILAEMYRRFTAGESYYRLVGDLNRRAIKTTAGGLWSDGTLRRALESGFGAGLVKYRGQLHPGAHEPVITEAEWQAYCDARTRRHRVAPRSQDSPYLLSGIVRCGCGSAMMGGTFGTGRIPKYRCERRRATAGAGCMAGYVSAATVHDRVRDWLILVAVDIESAAKAVELVDDLAAARRRDVDRLAREVARLEAAVVRVVRQEADDPYGEPALYAKARAEIQEQLASARTAAEDAAVQVRGLERGVAPVVRPLLDGWVTLQVPVRREMLRTLVERVEVWPATPDGTREVVVVPTWAS